MTKTLYDTAAGSATQIKKKLMNLAIVTLNVRNSSPNNLENLTDPISERPNGTFRRRCAWRNRRDLLVKTLLSTDADVIGLQEILSDQFDFLSSSLGRQFDLVGVGRDDGKCEGEYAPIAFRKEKFECIEWGTFWLSENPDIVGSRYPGACCVRICTWVRLKPHQHSHEGDRSACPHIIVANAHLDHKSEKARTFGCQVIDDNIRRIMKEGEVVIVVGDFNFQSAGEEGYRMLLSSTNSASLLPRWRDSFVDIKGQKVSPAEVERNGVTFHDFGRSSGQRIDFIFYLPLNGYVEIQTLESNVDKDGEDGETCFVSDHYLLASKFSIEHI